MKTMQLKLTPKEGTAPREILFQCVPIHDADDAGRVLRALQREADDQAKQIDYAIATDAEYFGVRGARQWLLTEPGDPTADHEFKLALVRAGLFEDAAHVIGMICTGEDDYRVQVITELDCTTIDTKACTVEKCPHIPEGWGKIEVGPTN